MAHQSSREELWDLIKHIRFAMFTTRHDNGHLHSRPMTTQTSKLGDDDSLWFFMSRSGDPVGDLRNDAIVNVAYADPENDSYVSVSGVASVVEDVQTKRELWSKMNEAWFPGGPEDADVALVRVAIEHAEYWNVRDSKPVQLLRMAKAAVTGVPPSMGEKGHVRMGGTAGA
jgi:general stress protein 26